MRQSHADERWLRLQPDFQKTISVDISITTAGAFAFYLTYSPLPDFSSGGHGHTAPIRTQTYFIDVSPDLQLADQRLPLSALSILSVISKFMGKYPTDWEDQLRGISQRGYNMIHFTPLMVRGASNSPYSLANQLEFDSHCFPNGEKDVESLIRRMKDDYGLLGLTDVVWNHTAHTSEWLEEHPEAGYNVINAPWLESALELDTALINFSGKFKDLQLPVEPRTTEALLEIMEQMQKHCLEGPKMWQFYVIEVDRNARSIVQAWERSELSSDLLGFGNASLTGAGDWSRKQQAAFLCEKGLIGGSQMASRFSRRVDASVGATLLAFIFGRFDPAGHGASLRAAQSAIVNILDELNDHLYGEYSTDLAEIMDQVFNRAKYLRIDDHGPRMGSISKESPLVEPYFTRLPLNSVTAKHDPMCLAVANNGWIWGADAMKDHAGPESRAYLLRQVIVWSDCVKLRYGKVPKDNPFLWDHMAKYTRLMAKHFAAFRIDNCHSTPLVVAEYLLDQARQVRPNLAIFAELFTGSEPTDYVFVKRLGLSALIREAMQAWSTAELSRLVHRHGGRPIGSFEPEELPLTTTSGPSTYKEVVTKVKRSPLHALFMDCTHDNEVPAQKRDARDTLPNAALVEMCACSVGSTMGYDEIYPKLVDLVNETRLYSSTLSDAGMRGGAGTGTGTGGIGGVKKLLNQIHIEMGMNGFDETHVHHEGEHVTVHRVHPSSRRGYLLAAHTAFPNSESERARLSPIRLTGTKAKFLGCWTLEVNVREDVVKGILSDAERLRGLPSKVMDLDKPVVTENSQETLISLPDRFPPGSIALFQTWIPDAERSEGLDNLIRSDTEKAFANLSLTDLHFLLYRCEAEERDSSGGADGVYDIPGHGSLVYAGLQGWWSVLSTVVRNNDLSHAICNHLRQGQWPLDYMTRRIERLAQQDGRKALNGPGQWLTEKFEAIRKIPSFLLPRYFALVIQTAYNAAWKQGLGLMSEDIRCGNAFFQQLAMTSIQVTGPVRSASLWPSKGTPCMAAGLPHFATDWARCWGRDVFISVSGLYLGTGRHLDAKEHIVAFASVLRHGMIPNLLSSGKAPRYNARDSIWFFLQSIQDYTNTVSNGTKILHEKVPRRFLPYDDAYFEFDDPRAYSVTSTIADIIQEALQRHASGISFREANAGPQLDMQMRPGGFDINIRVDWTNGLIFGGSQDNCGTWMDKMGESERAGSKGVPGTPRDGAAIEITGMLYSTLVWLSTMHEQGHYPHEAVKTDDQEEISFADWASRIKTNFERCYYVPRLRSEDKDFDVDSNIVNRRGIYKDLYRSGKPYEDYQLRCNFPIAMTYAPQLFTLERALGCLEIADKSIRGPLGMATLDPMDENYRPYYVNSEESENFATSKGRNYHQGPEWVWPRGYFLRALLKFDVLRSKTQEQRVEAFQRVSKRLQDCKRHIEESPWRGLPELTNRNGEHCADSVRHTRRASMQD